MYLNSEVLAVNHAKHADINLVKHQRAVLEVSTYHLTSTQYGTIEDLEDAVGRVCEVDL
jgi:hypothetical protein